MVDLVESSTLHIESDLRPVDLSVYIVLFIGDLAILIVGRETSVDTVQIFDLVGGCPVGGIGFPQARIVRRRIDPNVANAMFERAEALDDAVVI